MNTVFSSKSLKERIQKLPPLVAGAQAVAARASLPIRPRRNAIFVIHGISPIQRYAIQDQFADGLFAFLSAQGGAWKRATHWPPNSANSDITPSAIRIYDATDGAGPETSPSAHDIYEGYWSPLSKGKTSFISALQWLFNMTFLASSSTADLPCNWNKLRWDAGYLSAGLGASVLLGAGAIVSAGVAWRTFTKVATGKAAQVPASIQDFVAASFAMPASAYVSQGVRGARAHRVLR